MPFCDEKTSRQTFFFLPPTMVLSLQSYAKIGFSLRCGIPPVEDRGRFAGRREWNKYLCNLV